MCSPTNCSSSSPSSFRLSEVCGPIEGALTEEQLKLIEKRLNRDLGILRIVFHALPLEVHDRSLYSKNLVGRHPLSGNSDANMYQLFGKSCSDLDKTFEKGRLMALAFDEVIQSEDFYEKAMRGVYMTPAELKVLFSNAVRQFQDNIASLSEGDLLIMPSSTYSHALAYVVKAKEDGICTFSIINTGLGCSVFGSTEEGRAQAPSFDVPKELLPLLIDPILTFIYATYVGRRKNYPQETRANFVQALEQFYAKIKRLFAKYPEYKQPHVMQIKGYGTCSATCLHAALEVFDPNSLVVVHESGILTADSEVKVIHQRNLELSRSLSHCEKTEKIKDLSEKATLYAWWAFGLKNILARDSQCIQTKEDNLLDSLGPEFEIIKANVSLVFHLLPHDIHALEYLRKRSADLFGSKHPLEGNSSAAMYRIFREVVPVELTGTFEKGLEIAEEFARIQNLLNADSSSYNKRMFDSVKAKIRSGFQALRQGELLLINGGTSRHAFVYAVKYNYDETYTISVINTGFGGDLSEDTVKAPAFIVPKERALKDGRLIQIIIDTAEASLQQGSSDEEEWEKVFEESMGGLLYKLRRLFDGCEEGYFEHFSQVHGTCSASCLQAAIEVFAPRIFQEFRLNSLNKVCEMSAKCREDLLKLREELPSHGRPEELREKIEELLYELFCFAEAVEKATEDTRVVVASAATAARRHLGELFREEESELGALSIPSATKKTAANKTASSSRVAVLSPATVPAVTVSPMDVVAEFRGFEAASKLLDLEMS